jgi:aerobic-type carbon monoxide dehydrogenase small subunit (CoxS/CutS family)
LALAAEVRVAIKLILNGKPANFAWDPSMPLPWYVRYHERLTGTEIGCGIGHCGG